MSTALIPEQDCFKEKSRPVVCCLFETEAQNLLKICEVKRSAVRLQTTNCAPASGRIPVDWEYSDIPLGTVFVFAKLSQIQVLIVLDWPVKIKDGFLWTSKMSHSFKTLGLEFLNLVMRLIEARAGWSASAG